LDSVLAIWKQISRMFLLFFIVLLPVQGADDSWSTVDVPSEKPKGVKEISIDFAPPAREKKSIIKKKNTTKRDLSKPKRNKPPHKRVKHKTRHTHKKKIIKKKSHRVINHNSQTRTAHASQADLARFASRVRAKIEANAGTKPMMAIHRNISGTAMLSFMINKSGYVSSITTSGMAIFGSSAQSALQRSLPFDTSGVKSMMPRYYSVPITYR